MEVVGITGYAQHGKDTAGRRLVEEHGFTRYAFADGVREMALAIDPYVGAWSGADEDRLSWLVAQFGWDHAKADPEVRRLLQVIGTEAVRDILGEDSWVNALQRKAERDGATRIVVTDVRFPNEAEWVHAMRGVLWRVHRVMPGGFPFENGTGNNAAHPSEANVPLLPFDRLIVNDSTPRFLNSIDEAVKGLTFGEVDVTAYGDAERTLLDTATGRTRTEPLGEVLYHEAETAAEPVDPRDLQRSAFPKGLDAAVDFSRADVARRNDLIRVEWTEPDGSEGTIERPATVTVIGPTTEYEVEAERDEARLSFRYRRVDKMEDHEHLDAVRRHYR